MKYKRLLALIGGVIIISSLCLAEPLLVPSPEEHTLDYAVNFQKTANITLAPVYAPLAQQITEDFKLQDKKGIGVDLGSGPGNLIIELCKVTKNMHWVNADINPFFFPMFYEAAEKADFGHRVSAIFADSQALPFRYNYADIIVSRGSFHFWDDKEKAFGEIYRVLKPEGTAFIGRGFSRNMPVEAAKAVRSRQGKGKGGMPKYSVSETADELKGIMESLNIEDYRIHTPTPPGSDGVNYGIWLEFHKK